MPTPLVLAAALRHCFVTIAIVLLDVARLLTIPVRSRRALDAENLFLRKQLALFQEWKVEPRRADYSARWVMATLRCFDFQHSLSWSKEPFSPNT
jgi:putative transposase